MRSGRSPGAARPLQLERLVQVDERQEVPAQPMDRRAVEPLDVAEAILYLAGPRARRTTGHLIPVDGGLVDAFLR